jgi:hypothetical protein
LTGKGLIYIFLLIKYFLILIYIYIIILNYIFLFWYFVLNFLDFLSIINIQYKILKKWLGRAEEGSEKAEFDKDQVRRTYFLKIESGPWKARLLLLERSGPNLWEHDKDRSNWIQESSPYGVCLSTAIKGKFSFGLFIFTDCLI